MPPKKGECDVKFGNNAIRWSGYKARPDSIVLSGEWYCLMPDKTMFYSSTSGTVGKTSNPYTDMPPGAVPFDKNPVTIFSSAADKERRKQESLAILIEYIQSRGSNA